MTQSTAKIPSYLDAFTKDLRDRDRIRRLVQKLFQAGLIERYRNVPFLGPMDLLQRFEYEMQQRPDSTMSEAVKLIKQEVATW